MKTSLDPTAAFRRDSDVFRSIWSSYEYRPQQEKMATSVEDALEERRHLLVEAGTGVGKTLAYLLPILAYALENEVRVAISTETRSLQKQILEKDIPLAEKILGKSIQAEICLGASNYVCKRKLEKVVREGSFDPDMQDHLAAFLDWEKKTPTGVRQDYDGEATWNFWDMTTRDADDCLGSRCPNFESSFYFVAKERWKRANVLIMNHSLLSSHLAMERKLLPEFECLVIDEAHRFPDIFASAYQNSASFSEAQSLIKVCMEYDVDGPAAFEAFQTEFTNNYSLRPGERKRIHEKIKYKSLKNLLSSLDKMSARLDEIVSGEEKLFKESDEMVQNEKMLQLSARLARVNDLRIVLGSFAAGPGDENVHWITRPENDARMNYFLTEAPVSTSGKIERDLLSQYPTVIFTSATLSTAGPDAFAYFKKEIGAEFLESDRLKTIRLDSPFDYKKNCVLYLPSNIPDPSQSEEDFHRMAAQVITHVVRLSRGGAFVLFTSGRSLRAVRELINEDESEKNFNILSQLELGPARALSEFLRGEQSALFGLATFWQGIDIPGDALRLVILVRIPFRVPDDPILEAKMEREKQAGRSPFGTIQLPQAVISVKQGFGRLIRTHQDRGAVVILDPRITTKSYGKTILNALPPCRVVNTFGAFRHAVKDFYTSPV